MRKYIFIATLIITGSNAILAQGEINDSLLDRVSISVQVFNKMPGLFFEEGLNCRLSSNNKIHEANFGFGFRNSYVASCGFISEIHRHKMKILSLGANYFFFKGSKYHFEPNNASTISLYQGDDLHVLRPSLNLRFYMENEMRIQLSLGYGFILNQSSYKLLSGPDDYSKQMNLEFSDGIICGVEFLFRMK